MTEPLDPLRLPLWGSRLIEASAGTGKTFTIAALYLRLVLGHGRDDSAFGRPLAPSEILVMTFTVAATRELSERIRARLVEAAACFRGVPTTDALLLALLAEHPEGAARDEAAWRLAMAAEAMDDAAVHTIDAWCQRMLREHAFDSGSLFDEELQVDQTQLLAQAARDYWRQQVYPLTGATLDAVLAVWADVDALTRDAAGLIDFAVQEDIEIESLCDLCGRVGNECAQGLKAFKAEWAGRVPRMREWLDDLAASGIKLKPPMTNYLRWVDTLRDWATGDAPMPDLQTGWDRLPAAELLSRNPNLAARLPDDFEHFTGLRAALAALPQPAVAMRLHAAGCIARRMQQLKRAAGTYGFADLLERLDAALDGPNGARLRERIALQYPVALIDEFQDTSPLQYRLFDRLYRTASNARETGLFLIGDPKQSIYGFRGADIRSYLQARTATTGRHYALGTNYRATEGLVAAVNELFGAAEKRDGPGAFRFRTASVASENDALPFTPVRAQGRDEQLVNLHGALPAVTLVHDPELSGAPDARQRFAALCAERIVDLLNDRQAGFARNDDFVRLRPADIAVLVRSGVEADAVRRALRQREVASVYLSDRDSVFASPEASDLLLWLKAVAEPLDSRRARVALASATIGLPLAELARLGTDDLALEQRIEQLRQLNGAWQRQGVLAMLRQTLHRLDLPARWLAQPDGERRLTNVLHLAELLQAASAQVDGEQGLIRWFARQVDGDAAAVDEAIVRLESDADLVKVVTVHKSKGLEYPLVFLPFVCSFRANVPGRRGYLSLPGADGGRELVFEPDDVRKAEADEERLQEDLRLLYVAVTRARHALWIGVSARKQGTGKACTFAGSAFGYLLSGEPAVGEQEIDGLLQTYASWAPETTVELTRAAPSRTMLRRGEAVPPLRDALRYSAGFERNWSIASFSALVRDIGMQRAATIAVDPVRQEKLLTMPADAVPVTTTASATAPWHRFPRGALPGNFLHEQLEWLAEQRFAMDDADVRERLQRRCERQGWGHRAGDVVAWMHVVAGTPLPPLGVALAAVERTVSEMEFWFPAEGIAAARLDALCRQHLLPGTPRPALPERRLHGMLMGFADLVIEHEGRWWVLDHKSNALGDHDGDYHASALDAAMAEHRYDVQAAIYLLALHRLLRSRLGAAYRPGEHLGGAIYLFLRGIRGPQAGCHVLPAPLELLLTLDAEMDGAPEVLR